VSDDDRRVSYDAAIRRTVVLGKGSLAVRVASWFHESSDHELVRIVPVIPEPTWTESLSDWARANDVPAVSSGDYRELPGDEPVDLAFSVFYDRVIRRDFIDACGRILNLHNGPLPRYRGVSPINWALKNGETTHGVTIHEIVEAVDAGPVVAQVMFSIYPEIDEVRDVYDRALEYAWVLFRETMALLDRIEPVPQDDALATYYGLAQNDELGERRGFSRADSRS
jgi:hypothetical protein